MAHVDDLLTGWAASGREPGAALCVVRADGSVDEVCVGTRDGVRPWDTETLVMTWSVAKPFAALTVLTVVADGALALDQRVVDLWPAYAAEGKGGTTVRHVLSHAAGLPVFPEAASELEYDDRDGLVALLAEAAPWHEPGAGVAEHALTYGHLCDELVRRATGEDLADRFARIASAHGWDLHLRVAAEDLGRVADVVALDGWPQTYVDDPRWGPALTRPPGLLEPATQNSERFRTCSFPAVALHASAAGLARFYADLMPSDGPVAQLLGPVLHRAHVTAQATGHDLVLDREVAWTLGYQVDDEAVGMGGAGGCSGWVTHTGTAVGWVTRGLGDHDKADQLWDAIS
jgi:CubicO group peptidase (beta-lactamase class C family)